MTARGCRAMQYIRSCPRLNARFLGLEDGSWLMGMREIDLKAHREAPAIICESCGRPAKSSEAKYDPDRRQVLCTHCTAANDDECHQVAAK